MKREIVHSERAPKAIGPYSQAVKVGSTVYLSGQIPLVPETGEVEPGDFAACVRRVLDNLQAVIAAAGGTFANIVKLNVFLTDLANFPVVNQIMTERFQPPYPARAAIGVAALPRGVPVEMDAIVVLDD